MLNTTFAHLFGESLFTMHTVNQMQMRNYTYKESSDTDTLWQIRKWHYHSFQKGLLKEQINQMGSSTPAAFDVRNPNRKFPQMRDQFLFDAVYRCIAT